MSSRTENDERPAKLPDLIFDVPDGNGQSDKIVEKIERLETELSSAKDGRREERFYWVLATVFLSNFIFAKFLDNTIIFFVMLMPQLFMLVALARYLGVDWAVEPIERALQWLDKHFKNITGK